MKCKTHYSIESGVFFYFIVVMWDSNTGTKLSPICKDAPINL